MRLFLMCLALLGASPAWADFLVVQFTGEVVTVTGQQNGGSLDQAAIGDPVEGLFVFDPDQFPLGSGDGSTFIAIRDPWNLPLDLLRTRLLIGGVPFPTDDPAFPFTLGTSQLREGSGGTGPSPAPTDGYFVNAWSSTFDLSDLGIVYAPLRIVNLAAVAPSDSGFVSIPVTSLFQPLDFSLAATRTLSVIEGIGQRVGNTGNFGFVFNDPARPTRSITVTLTAVTKSHCQNRIPWVDQGQPFPDHPIGCGVSQRPTY
jgi:hypothetical protein